MNGEIRLVLSVEESRRLREILAETGDLPGMRSLLRAAAASMVLTLLTAAAWLLS